MKQAYFHKGINVRTNEAELADLRQGVDEALNDRARLSRPTRRLEALVAVASVSLKGQAMQQREVINSYTVDFQEEFGGELLAHSLQPALRHLFVSQDKDCYLD